MNDIILSRIESYEIPIKKAAEKEVELREIRSRISKLTTELKAVQDSINLAKKGRMKGLRDTFNTINAKTTKSYQEIMFLRAILGLVGKWQTEYPKLYPPTAPDFFDVADLRNKLDDSVKTPLDGDLSEYRA